MGEMMGTNDVGRTSTRVTEPVTVEAFDEVSGLVATTNVRLVMTLEQAHKLFEVLDCTDDDLYRYDWREPEVADFVRDLAKTLREELGRP